MYLVTSQWLALMIDGAINRVIVGEFWTMCGSTKHGGEKYEVTMHLDHNGEEKSIKLAKGNPRIFSLR